MKQGIVARAIVSIFSVTHQTSAVGSSFPLSQKTCLTAPYKLRISFYKIIPVFMWFRSRIQKLIEVNPVESKVNTGLSPVKQPNLTKHNLTLVETQILFKRSIRKS